MVIILLLITDVLRLYYLNYYLTNECKINNLVETLLNSAREEVTEVNAAMVRYHSLYIRMFP